MKTRKNLIVFFCLLILITSACMSREKANEVMMDIYPKSWTLEHCDVVASSGVDMVTW